MMLRNIRSARGFTLLEIAVAVTLIGFFLTTLLSLQTQYLEMHYQEDHRTRAAMYAEYLMTTIDAKSSSPPIGSEEGDLVDELRDAGYFQESDIKNPERELKGWRYKREVVQVPVPPLEDALRRIDLSVSWGESAAESFSVVYFRKP